jgi:hypothetical protein
MNVKGWAVLILLALALIGYTLVLEVLSYAVYRRWRAAT